MGYWLKDGKIIVDKDTGKVINCNECPCGAKCEGYTFKKIINVVVCPMGLDYDDNGNVINCWPDCKYWEKKYEFIFSSCRVSRSDKDYIYVTATYKIPSTAPEFIPDSLVDFNYRFPKIASPGSAGVLESVHQSGDSSGDVLVDTWVWPAAEETKFPESCGWGDGLNWAEIVG